MDPQQPPTRGPTRSYDATGTTPPGFNAGGPPDPSRRSEGGGGDAKQFADDARQQARAATDTVKQGATEAARQVSEQVKGGAQAVSQQVGQQATEAARMLREHGASMLTDQKQRAAGSLEGIGSAIRGAADRLHEAKDDNIAHYLDAAAETVERATQYLKGSEVGQLMHDAQNLARRRPEWFFGGAFIAGLALARFAKARRPEPRGGSYGYDQSSFGPSGYGDAEALLPSPAQATRPSEFDRLGPAASASLSSGSNLSGAGSTSSGSAGTNSMLGSGSSAPGSGSSASAPSVGAGTGSFVVTDVVTEDQPARFDGPDILSNSPAKLVPPTGGGGMNS